MGGHIESYCWESGCWVCELCGIEEAEMIRDRYLYGEVLERWVDDEDQGLCMVSLDEVRKRGSMLG